MGTVSGIVKAENGITPIQGATVTVQSNYTNMPVTETDIVGQYTLQGVPVNNQTIIATKGMFSATVSVIVQENQTITAPTLLLKSTGKLGYVRGAYDRMEEIVRDTLGYDIEEVDADSLVFPAVLSRYRAIFLNCGMNINFLDANDNVANNLRNYVSNGGSFYVSDWGQEVVRRMFPEDVSGKKRIGKSQVIYGKIVDTDLRAFVGKDSVKIDYDLSSWEILDSLSNFPKVLIRATYDTYSGLRINAPLVILINHGKGKVIYTTFHNEANVTADVVKVLTYFLFTL